MLVIVVIIICIRIRVNYSRVVTTVLHCVSALTMIHSYYLACNTFPNANDFALK